MPVQETLAALRKGYGAHSAAQSRGAGCLTFAWALTIITPFSAEMLEGAFIRGNPSVSAWEVLLPTIPILLTCVLATIGVFWLTRKPPRHLARWAGLRLSARWLFAVAIPLFAIAACAEFVERMLWTGAVTNSASANFAAWIGRLARVAIPGAYVLFLAVPLAIALVFWYSSTLPFTRVKSRYAARLIAVIMLYVTAYFVVLDPGRGAPPPMFDTTDYRTLIALSVGISGIFAAIVGLTYWLNLWLRARKIARVGRRLTTAEERETPMSATRADF